MNIRYLLCAVVLTSSLSAMQKFKSPEEHLQFVLSTATSEEFESKMKEVEATITKGTVDITAILNDLNEKIESEKAAGNRLKAGFYLHEVDCLLNSSEKFRFNLFELKDTYNSKPDRSTRQLVAVREHRSDLFHICNSLNSVDKLLFKIYSTCQGVYDSLPEILHGITEPLNISAVLQELSKRINYENSDSIRCKIKVLLSEKDKFYYDPTTLDLKFFKDYIVPIEAELAAEKQAADAAAAKK